MKRFALFLLILPVVAFGDDPLACVDPEFANAFLLKYGQGSPEYSSNLPAEFPQFILPASYSLIGSESSDHGVRAIYKSDATPAESVSVFVNHLVGEEWRDVTDNAETLRGGFQSRRTVDTVKLCRDTEPGILHVQASENAGQTHLQLFLRNFRPGQNCADLETQAEYRTRSYINYRRALPQIFLPDDVQSFGSGSGGGSDESHSYVKLNTNISRNTLVSYFGDQIRDQGWTFDSGWSGNVSSGSVWSKTSTDGEPLIGVLNAYGESQSSYRVRITVFSAESRDF